METPVDVQHRVDRAAMLDHHALGYAGRTGSVDHVGRIPGAGRGGEIVLGSLVNARPVCVQANDFCRVSGQVSRQLLLRQQHGRPAVFEHVGNAVARIIRVQGHISPPRLEDAEQADDHVG